MRRFSDVSSSPKSSAPWKKGIDLSKSMTLVFSIVSNTCKLSLSLFSSTKFLKLVRVKQMMVAVSENALMVVESKTEPAFFFPLSPEWVCLLKKSPMG